MSSARFFGGVRVAHLVPCCGVRYDFRMRAILGSSLPPVVCGRVGVLLPLFVYACVWWCLTHSVLCCVFLRLVYPVLQVSLDCPFLTAPSVFSNVCLPHMSNILSLTYNWVSSVKWL